VRCRMGNEWWYIERSWCVFFSNSRRIEPVSSVWIHLMKQRFHYPTGLIDLPGSRNPNRGQTEARETGDCTEGCDVRSQGWSYKGCSSSLRLWAIRATSCFWG
jgi:hypothetical protein